MAVIGKPSASSMAAANTAADGITPASPAPLMPSGLSGDGVSRWSMSIDVGHLGDVGHQEVHERRVEQLAGLVVGHPLVERAADALRDAAVDLALDDHRVDQVAAVVDHGVLQDPDLRGQRVGLDDHGVHAGGERRPLGRVEVPALQARLVVLGAPAACPGRRPRTGWPPWTPRRRRSAAGWTAPRPCRGRSRRPGCPSPTPRRRRSRGRPARPRARRPRSAAPSPWSAWPRGGSPSRSSPRRARRTCPRRTASGGCRR